MTIMEKASVIAGVLSKKKRPYSPDRFAIMDLISTVLWTAYRQHWSKDSSEVVFALSYMEDRFLDGSLRAESYSLVSDAIRDADQWHTPLQEICAIRGETNGIIIVSDEDARSTGRAAETGGLTMATKEELFEAVRLLKSHCNTRSFDCQGCDMWHWCFENHYYEQITLPGLWHDPEKEMGEDGN